MLKWYKDRQITNGPVFRKKNGKRGKANDYEFDLCQRLERNQRDQPSLLDPDLDVTEAFGLSRSFRRGSDILLLGMFLRLLQSNVKEGGGNARRKDCDRIYYETVCRG